MRPDDQEGRISGPPHFSPVLAAALAVLLALVAWQWVERSRPVVHGIDGYTMGSTWSVRVAAPREFDTAVLRAALETRLRSLDQQLSGYRPGTGLMQVNQAAPDTWVTMPSDLAQVLGFGLALHRESEGAFDMSVRPLVQLWGFGAAAARSEPPSDAEIAEARQLLGSGQFELSPDGGRIRRSGTATLDVDAIAPGHAADALAAVLEAQGLHDYLTEVGGELRASGRRPDGAGWRVGIERPVMARGELAEVIEVDAGGIATSGDYRDYFELAGVRYSHTLDPATGRPVRHELASVTVIAPTALEADGYATAISVLGPERGMAFAGERDLAVFMILRDGQGGYRERYNQAFAPYLGALPAQGGR